MRLKADGGGLGGPGFSASSQPLDGACTISTAPSLSGFLPLRLCWIPRRGKGRWGVCVWGGQCWFRLLDAALCQSQPHNSWDSVSVSAWSQRRQPSSPSPPFKKGWINFSLRRESGSPPKGWRVVPASPGPSLPTDLLPLSLPGELLPRPHQDCAQLLGQGGGALDLRGRPALQHHLPSGHPGTAGLDAAPARAGAPRPALAALPLAPPSPSPKCQPDPVSSGHGLCWRAGCPGLHGSPSFQGPRGHAQASHHHPPGGQPAREEPPQFPGIVCGQKGGRGRVSLS